MLAEGAGFEPAVGRPTIDFKSTAFDRSASPPSRGFIIAKTPEICNRYPKRKRTEKPPCRTTNHRTCVPARSECDTAKRTRWGSCTTQIIFHGSKWPARSSADNSALRTANGRIRVFTFPSWKRTAATNTQPGTTTWWRSIVVPRSIRSSLTA